MSTGERTPHIEQTPGVSGGKPRIAGRRLTVQFIASLHERAGWSVDEIASEYELKLAEIHAALAYYFDHREEIDAQANDDLALVAKIKEQSAARLRDAE